MLRINDNGRFNLALKYERSTALTEAERDIIPDTPRLPYDSIGHVTARHAAQQYTRGMGASLGVLAASIFVPAVRPFGDLAQGRFRV